MSPPTVSIRSGNPDAIEIAALLVALQVVRCPTEAAACPAPAGRPAWTRSALHEGPAAWTAAEDRHLR